MTNDDNKHTDLRAGMDNPPPMTQLQKDFRRLQRERAARWRTLPEDMPDFVPEGQDAPATHPAWAEKPTIEIEESLSDDTPSRRPPAPKGYFNCFCGNMHTIDKLGRATDHKDERPPEPERAADITREEKIATFGDLLPILQNLAAALEGIARIEQAITSPKSDPDMPAEYKFRCLSCDNWYKTLEALKNHKANKGH